jgi:hypothetical protein
MSPGTAFTRMAMAIASSRGSIERELALRKIREDEHRSRAHLKGSHTTGRAYTEITISRALYRMIEEPPTRHRRFTIRTIWLKKGWIPEKYYVAVRDRGRRYFRCVLTRAGQFGDPV